MTHLALGQLRLKNITRVALGQPHLKNIMHIAQEQLRLNKKESRSARPTKYRIHIALGQSRL